MKYAYLDWLHKKKKNLMKGGENYETIFFWCIYTFFSIGISRND